MAAFSRSSARLIDAGEAGAYPLPTDDVRRLTPAIRVISARRDVLGVASLGESENPWIRPRVPAEPETPAPAPEESHARPAHQAGVSAPGDWERLSQRELTREELLRPLWVTGAHGGAGTTTMARLLGAGDAGRAWPIAPWSDRRPRVLLCARTSYTGLRAAQIALREWAAGAVPVSLDGVVLNAAAPKQARELRPLLDRVRAAASGAVWEIGWHGQWLLGEPDMPKDKQLERLLDLLTTQQREQ